MICLPKPNRHHNCINYAVECLRLTPPIGAGVDNQGFYLADGTYLNRKDALTHVEKIGQKMKENTNRYLFSENLW